MIDGQTRTGDGRRTPLRLVAIAPSSLVSGAEMVLLRVLRSATDAGWDVRCACPEGPLADRLHDLGIQRDDMPDLRLPTGQRLFGMVAMISRNLRAAAQMRRVATGCDVLLVNSLNALVALRLARLRVPTAWLLHDVIVRRDRLAFVRAGIPAVDLVVAVSEAAARSLPEHRARTVVIRNGTPWPVDPARPPTSPTKVIGCNAVLTPWKGQDVLLEAVALLRRDDVFVDLVGGTLPKDGRYAAALRSRAARTDLSGHVRFLGQLDDPVEVMRDWTVAVCPSVEPEAVSLAVLEAMSIGLPVVGTDHGGIPEFLGAAGLLVGPGDPDALCEALERLLDDDALRTRCSAAGPEVIASSLTLEGRLQALLDALGDLTATAHPRGPGAIIFAVPDFEPTLGGTTRQTGNQARALLRSDDEVAILTQRLERGWQRYERIDGLPVHRLLPSGRSTVRMKGLVISTAWWLRRHRREIRAVHVLMYPDLAVASAFAGLADRTVMSWAGRGDATDALTPSGGAFRRALGAFRRSLLSPITHVALTPAIAAELDHIGVGSDVIVVPTPVDTERFRPPTEQERSAARVALHLAGDEVAIVYTGHLRSLKRVDALITAFAMLIADGRRARLILVGGTRSDLEDTSEALRRQVHDLGIDAVVLFIGEVPTVATYLHAADIFVLPSDREGLPNSILEAMACGLPVVAPPSAAGDQVLDASSGIVPESNDPSRLCDAMAVLADDPSLRHSLGSRAREVAADYELSSVVRALQDVYAGLGASPETSRSGAES